MKTLKDLQKMSAREFNQLTLEEIKEAFANYRNSDECKEKEAYAASLKTKKVEAARAKSKKYRLSTRTRVAGTTRRLNWQAADANGVTNLDKMFQQMSDLLGTDFRNWKHDENYDEVAVMVAEDIFGNLDLDDHGTLNIIQKVSVWISNLNLALRYAKVDTEATKDILQGYFWHAYTHPVKSAIKAGLIGEAEGNEVLNYLENLK